MNYKNKLMGLSLIILAMFSACTDDVENGGRDSGTGDHRITFAVGTAAPDARTRADGSHSGATESYETSSVEMQGKLDGKTVYLTAEVSDAFPGDDQPLTRGTQVTAASQMDAFAVSAYMSNGGWTPVIYNAKVTNKNPSSTWMPEEPFFWPNSNKGSNLMDFYAWYPYESGNLSISAEDYANCPKLTYEIPDKVINQQDVMTASVFHKSEASSVPLAFEHMLAAVRFKTSSNIPACTVKAIALKGVKYKGSYSAWQNGTYPIPWKLDETTKDFTLDFPNGKKIPENTETELTGDGETFFMMPQTFGDDSEARLEVTLEMNGTEQTIGAKLKELTNTRGSSDWHSATTVTYQISLDQNVELELNKDVFVASGADAVIYVKSNCGWECTLSDPNGITGSAAPALCKPTLKGSTSGVQSDSFDNENAKLTLETIQPTDTETRKGKVKLTFTFPSKPGKTVEKEVTLTSSLMVEYPAGSDIWYKVTKGTITGEKLVTTDTPAIPDNADFATAIAKVAGADVTYSRELVATRVLNDDDATQCLTKFAIRRAKADGSTTTVTFSVITLERQDGSSTFDEKNFMTWGDTYYPIGSTWVVNKDNFNVTTDTEDLGKKSVWESIAAPSWSYNQVNFSFMDQVYMMPGYRTMQNTNLTIYSIEKVSN